MAATLLVGVGIGRYAMQQAPAGPAPTQVATETPSAAPAGTTAVGDAPTSPLTADAPPAPVRLPRGPRTPTQLASTGEVEITGPSPMQLASRQHLARAEALISVVAATPADAVMDSLTGNWAREMLTNTRLLLDSPAGDDPARRRLFEDLEMILVQLVQRSGTSADERRLIDRSLQRTQLLTRLRTNAAGI
jgi:hypothetical protein